MSGGLDLASLSGYRARDVLDMSVCMTAPLGRSPAATTGGQATGQFT